MGSRSKINDSGIRIDPLLVERAIECDADFQRRRTEEARELTGLENPNSVTQLKTWLEEQEGITVEGLTKDTVPVLLEQVKERTAGACWSCGKKCPKPPSKIRGHVPGTLPG